LSELLKEIKVISFDMEGTLIDHAYSKSIWENDIPTLYAKKNNINISEAKRRVFLEYDSIGDSRPEWYDVGYWFNRFDLNSDWHELAKRRANTVKVYPEIDWVLQHLSKLRPLIICSNTIRDFLDVQVKEVGNYFTRVFSAPSDFDMVKKDTQFYEIILDILDLDPCQLVHVGDHYKYDYLSARQLGIRAFYMDRSCESAGQYAICNLDEFVSILENP
jgi:HAD superfamily hydrolase (TIGR01549 family)